MFSPGSARVTICRSKTRRRNARKISRRSRLSRPLRSSRRISTIRYRSPNANIWRSRPGTVSPCINPSAESTVCASGSIPHLLNIASSRENRRDFQNGHIDPLQVPNNKNPARVVPVYRRVGACRGTLWGDNKGHDKNRPDGDKTLKLDWSDDKAGALAIIEYLKTR